MCFWVTVWLSWCIIYHNLPQTPPFLEGPSEKWNLAKDDSYQVISCSFLCLPSSTSFWYQLSLAKQNKLSISFACFSLSINTLFSLPFLLAVFYFLSFFFLLTSSCGEQRDGNKSYLHCFPVVLSSPRALRLLVITISASLEVSVHFWKPLILSQWLSRLSLMCWDNVEKTDC